MIRGITKFFCAAGVTAVLLVLLLAAAGRRGSVPPVPGPAVSSSSVSSLARVPVLFEPNVGQAAEGVDFIARDASGAVAISVSGIATPSFRQTLTNAGPSEGVGERPTASASNYFIGNDPAKWRTGVPNFTKVVYRDAYPSIDVEYVGVGNRLTEQFVVRPGGDPSSIGISLEGVASVAIDGNRVTAETENGTVVWDALHAFQVVNGNEVPVQAKFLAMGETGYAFAVGTYDRSLPLVIDPTLELEYGTYIGGTGDESGGGDTAVDSAGNLYLVGSSLSADFPTQNAYQGTFGGTRDITVTKFNPTGTALVWSTYIGGTANENGTGIGIDDAGEVVVYGSTTGTGYPTVNAYQSAFNGVQDAVLTKLSADGSTLLFSTYFGGSALDAPLSVLAVTGDGEAVIGGRTVSSADFPRLNAHQNTFGGGTQDAYVSRFDASGGLLWSTFLGGSSGETPMDLILDASGGIIVAGNTQSTNFPTVNPFQAAHAGGTLDIWVSRYSASGTLTYSTYLGGGGSDSSPAVAANALGEITLVGNTGSGNMPLVDPFQAANAGGTNDLYFARFNAAGSALIWSTYLGTAGNELPASGGIALDADDRVFFVARTDSAALPVSNEYQTVHGGGTDAVVGAFASDGQSLEFLSYFGGSGSEFPYGLTFVAPGTLYFGTVTASANMPVTAGAFQGAFAGGPNDSYVAKMSFLEASGGGSGEFVTPAIRLQKSADPSSLPNGPDDVTYTYLVTNPGFPPLSDVSVTDDRCSPLVFVSGDYNNDGLLQSYDQWQYVCSAHLEETTTNTATAVGFANTQRAESSSSVTVEVGSGLMEVMVEGLRAFINLQTGCRFFADDAFLNNPQTGLPEHPGEVCPGDFITTPSFRTVYYVTRDFVRRPFFNALVFLTHQPSFNGVKTVTDATLLTLRLGDLMTPKPGTVLIKFLGGANDVYVLFENPADALKPIARVLESESAASANFGPAWADFVIDLPPTMVDLFEYGAPILGKEEIDASRLLRREDLERIASPFTFAVLHRVAEMIGSGTASR